MSMFEDKQLVGRDRLRKTRFPTTGAARGRGCRRRLLRFEFPQDAPYRLWAQVKVENRILTAAFDADVTPKGYQADLHIF
jgi:hypothetical protein